VKIVFAGTSEFAVPCLRALAGSRHEVLAVITQPDRPRGRGGQMQPTHVKKAATELGLRVMEPEKLRALESVEQVKSTGADCMVVVAYGQKIPLSLLEWPRFGVVNVHGSLLPKYRGAAPIQRALMDGEAISGVTTMLLDEGWDTGDILLCESTPLLPDENAEELGARLATMGSGIAGAHPGRVGDRKRHTDPSGRLAGIASACY
jgi:methionyl-tRNA formyltransferase